MKITLRNNETVDIVDEVVEIIEYQAIKKYMQKVKREMVYCKRKYAGRYNHLKKRLKIK